MGKVFFSMVVSPVWFAICVSVVVVPWVWMLFGVSVWVVVWGGLVVWNML